VIGGGSNLLFKSDFKGTINAVNDKHAAQQVKESKWPEKDLYKARMAYDGGYYDRALGLLERYRTMHQSTWKTDEEFHYRLARIYHAKNQWNTAIASYEKTIELSEMKKGYFGPNSALNLGYIYTALDQKEKARVYFNTVFSYKNYGYKSSLDTQASLALKLLDN